LFGDYKSANLIPVEGTISVVLGPEAHSGKGNTVLCSSMQELWGQNIRLP